MKTIMHKRALDAAIRVMTPIYEDEAISQFIGYWIRLGYAGSPRPISRPEVITVKHNDDWVSISEELLAKPRTQPGIPT